MLPPRMALTNLPHTNATLCQIQFHHLVQNVCVDVIARSKDFGRTRDQPIHVVDNPADEIRDPSGRIRRMRTPLKDNDL